MKIGYMRFNLPVVLNYQNASIKTKGTDRRLGILEAFVKKGFEVECYSHIEERPQSNTMEDWVGNAAKPKVDYDFVTNIAVGENAKKPDCDVLFIENSTDNSMFTYKTNMYSEFGNATPYIYRTYDFINKFEGPTIYFQHDTSLGFAVEPQHLGKSDSEVAKLSIHNLGIMARKFPNLLKNKRFKLVTTANPELLIKWYSGQKRYPYHIFTQSCHIPLCYSENIDMGLELKEKPSHDLTYVGTEDGYRFEMLQKYLRLVENGCIIGDWKDKIVGKTTMMGAKGGHSDVYGFYNDSYTGLQVPNREDMKCANMTSRLVQIIRGGAIALVSSVYPKEVIDEYGCGYVVEKSEDVKNSIEGIKSLSLEERKEIKGMQQSLLKRWVDLDWGSVLKA